MKVVGGGEFFLKKISLSLKGKSHPSSSPKVAGDYFASRSAKVLIINGNLGVFTVQVAHDSRSFGPRQEDFASRCVMYARWGCVCYDMFQTFNI